MWKKIKQSLRQTKYLAHIWLPVFTKFLPRSLFAYIYCAWLHLLQYYRMGTCIYLNNFNKPFFIKLHSTCLISHQTNVQENVHISLIISVEPVVNFFDRHQRPLGRTFFFLLQMLAVLDMQTDCTTLSLVIMLMMMVIIQCVQLRVENIPIFLNFFFMCAFCCILNTLFICLSILFVEKH